MQTFKVRSRNFTYSVVIGSGAWRALREFPLKQYTSIFVLTEKGIWNRWSKLFLEESGWSGVKTLFVPAGEASKNLRMVARLAGQLLKNGADRRSCLALFGGGVVGDLGAFLASVYMRGMDCIHMPTTVLAQVDSAVGGKTAVNLGAMKNLIGTFHPGRIVVSDLRVLGSLGHRDFRSGLYEVLKHAVLEGPAFFRQLEMGIPLLTPGDIDGLEAVLPRAVKVKVHVVNRDERERSLRLTLNLGHTFGHALEEATRYRRFLHGEAVAWGLLAAALLGERLRLLAPGEGARIAGLVRQLGPLPSIRDLSAARVLRLLPQDKKSVGGKIQWVIPERIGKVRIVSDVPRGVVAAAFRDLQQMDPSSWIRE